MSRSTVDAMRLPLRRAGSPVLLAALVVALAAVPAHAAVKSAADPRTGIVFMLDGRP
jgi:hypothetical protein